MQSISRRLFGFGLAAGVGLGLAAAPQQAAAQWQPQKPVEFIIMAGQGGGEKNGFSNQPFIPINKGGGSGAEALRYLKDKEGDPHVIMATLNSLYTTPLRNPDIGVDISEFTPVARLAEDTFMLWVSSETDINSVDDYVKMVQEKGPADWKMGGTGTGQEDSLVTAMLENAYGIKHTYVPFKGGGTVAKNLVGNHVNATVNNPSEQLGFYDAGKSRPLAAFTPERLETFPDVPTFKELGQDMVYFMQRSVLAPAGIPQDVQDFYVGVFQKVHESEEWKTYTADKALFRSWLTGDELMEYFVAEREKHRELLKSTGEIQ